MEFLNKIYENDYFGIGLFAVISFLVIVFLIVLYFGKKDEKKRKSKLNTEDAFKETNSPEKVEIPIKETNLNDNVSAVPLNFDNSNLSNDLNMNAKENMEEKPIIDNNNLDTNAIPTTEPIAPVSIEENDIPTIEPIAPVSIEENAIPTIEPIAPVSIEENAIPTIEPIAPVSVEENAIPTIEPIKIDALDSLSISQNNEVVNPVNSSDKNEEVSHVNFMPNMDINNQLDNFTQPVITPIITEPTVYNFASSQDAKIIEPTKINDNQSLTLDKDISVIKPVIEEEISPLVVNEPVISDSYYKPIPDEKVEDLKVPNIDFDALAQSISDELDELEKRNEHQVNEVKQENDLKRIYVADSVKHGIELPKKIDLPNRKDE